MKITTFNPQIVTNNAEPIVKLFEELGFEKRHTKEGIGEMGVTDYRMKDGNGFNVDGSLAPLQLPQDLVTIRMNVDDFDAAYKLLEDHGFKNAFGDDRIADTPSSRNAVMKSPTGFTITLIQHVK